MYLSIIWEFTVAPEHVPAFEAAYGPAGAWVAECSAAPPPGSAPNCWPTATAATSRSTAGAIRAAYDAFRRSAAADYQSSTPRLPRRLRIPHRR